MSGWFVVKSNLPSIACLILPCYEPDSSQISRGSSSPSDEGSPKRPLLKFQNTAQRGFIAPSIVISLLLLHCTAIWVAVNQELPRQIVLQEVKEKTNKQTNATNTSCWLAITSPKLFRERSRTIVCGGTLRYIYQNTVRMWMKKI